MILTGANVRDDHTAGESMLGGNPAGKVVSSVLVAASKASLNIHFSRQNLASIPGKFTAAGHWLIAVAFAPTSYGSGGGGVNRGTAESRHAIMEIMSPQSLVYIGT